MFNGRRQPSRGGTSPMTRECQVLFCEGLGVKFPGPTRQFRLSEQAPITSAGAGTFGSSIPNSRSLASAEPPSACCAEALVFDISDAAARPAANTVRRSMFSMVPCSFLKFRRTMLIVFAQDDGPSIQLRRGRVLGPFQSAKRRTEAAFERLFLI
jgi:hypothetical protein